MSLKYSNSARVNCSAMSRDLNSSILIWKFQRKVGGKKFTLILENIAFWNCLVCVGVLSFLTTN
jgi:hypothetical protein